LVKQFDAMADMMKKLSGMGIRDRMKAMQQLGSSGMLNPGAKLLKQKKGTGKRLTSEERAKLKKLREREARRKKRDSRKDK
jgi:signal recognition particle subunit SRP54